MCVKKKKFIRVSHNCATRIIDTDPDSGGQNDADPTGSGSTSLLVPDERRPTVRCGPVPEPAHPEQTRERSCYVSSKYSGIKSNGNCFCGDVV